MYCVQLPSAVNFVYLLPWHDYGIVKSKQFRCPYNFRLKFSEVIRKTYASRTITLYDTTLPPSLSSSSSLSRVVIFHWATSTLFSSHAFHFTSSDLFCSVSSSSLIRYHHLQLILFFFVFILLRSRPRTHSLMSSFNKFLFRTIKSARENGAYWLIWENWTFRKFTFCW